MSNVEAAPAELRIDAAAAPVARGVEVLTPREVPLGGPRAMTVRRTLPQRARSLIGAWCFADHYGPDEVATSAGMDVPPHPHTGLQTVSWLFSGEVEHRDSGGHHAVVRPGELNLMTGGRGIAHSEVSTPGTTVLHGVQLWVALPDSARDTVRDFQHYAPPRVALTGGELRVFLGSLAGSRSPVTGHTPLLGAELVLDAGTEVELAVEPTFEHGVLVDLGPVTFEGEGLARGDLGYLGIGRTALRLANPRNTPARVLLLGGVPFEEEIVMWWNFVGRSHAEIAAFRDAWESGSEQFGTVEGYAGKVTRLPAPALPHVALRPRGNPAPSG